MISIIRKEKRSWDDRFLQPINLKYCKSDEGQIIY